MEAKIQSEMVALQHRDADASQGSEVKGSLEISTAFDVPDGEDSSTSISSDAHPAVEPFFGERVREAAEIFRKWRRDED